MGIIRIVISSSAGQTGGIVIDSRRKLDPQCSTKDDGNYASVCSCCACLVSSDRLKLEETKRGGVPAHVYAHDATVGFHTELNKLTH